MGRLARRSSVNRRIGLRRIFGRCAYIQYKIGEHWGRWSKASIDAAKSMTSWVKFKTSSKRI